MDFFGKISENGRFGMIESNNNNNIINIICGILLIILIVIIIICLVRKNDSFTDKNDEKIHIYHVVNENCPSDCKYIVQCKH